MSRAQVLLQSHMDDNTQTAPHDVLQQHFASGRKIRSPRDDWGRPPYAVLDRASDAKESRTWATMSPHAGHPSRPASTTPGSTCGIPRRGPKPRQPLYQSPTKLRSQTAMGMVRGFENPGITVPTGSLGRSVEEARRRCLTAGIPGGHNDFGIMAARITGPSKMDGKSDAPGPQHYRANYGALHGRPATIDMQKSLDRPPPNDPRKAMGGSHLELFSPNYSAVHERPHAMKMSKRPRNTDLVTLRVGVNCGADTSYEPSDAVRFHGNPHANPVRIGSCAGRSQKSATRFEVAFAIPGDFMPKNIVPDA
jgi:hypothetical protein